MDYCWDKSSKLILVRVDGKHGSDLKKSKCVDGGQLLPCDWHQCFLSDYEDYIGGFVASWKWIHRRKNNGFLREKNKETLLSFYILLPLQHHKTRDSSRSWCSSYEIHIEKPSESSPKDNNIHDSEDVADKEGQHQMIEDEQVLHDELEKMIAQEVIAKALDDATRQAFEEEKRNIASQKRAAQATSFNKLSTGRSSVSTATTPYVSAASTPTGANAGESSFVYLGGKIPIDASTLPNADLPID
ncbi:hypothetical protein Tco_0740859 [Tanacetum coccineum]